jgi:hypothetical protein
VSLGTYPAITLAEARAEARKIIRDAQLGVFNDDQDTSCPTFGKTVPLFIQTYAKPKNRGWKEPERLLGKFQTLDVVRVLDEIIASGTPFRANRALAAIKKLMSWALGGICPQLDQRMSALGQKQTFR